MYDSPILEQSKYKMETYFKFQITNLQTPNYIGYCEKSIDFPQKIAAKELNFSKLRIAHFKQA